ncbi:hypothetical protein RSAG8_09159, partial [Rhizoctonia solani AG-8 WAC10335]
MWFKYGHRAAPILTQTACRSCNSRPERVQNGSRTGSDTFCVILILVRFWSFVRLCDSVSLFVRVS